MDLRFHTPAMRAGRFFARCARAPLGVALALILWLGASPPVRAATAPFLATLSPVGSVQIGPLAVSGGFSLYLTGEDCGSSDPDVTLTYLSGTPTDRLSHTYTAASATCTIGARQTGARLRILIPGAIDIAVQLGAAGAPLARPGVPVGCGPPAGPVRSARVTGRIDVAIHPRVLGQLAINNRDGAGAVATAAEIFTGAPQTCPAVQAPNGHVLTADVGRYILNADQPSHGAAQLDILDEGADDPAPGLSGVLGLHLSGGPALSVAAGTGSARIGATTELTAGSLHFSPLAPCAGASAQNGSLSGVLTIEDPVLGPQRIVGSAADSADIGLGTAEPGSCNGPGSEPLEPELVDTCDSSDSGCSVTDGGGAVTFFDETSSGTQTITGETLDYGDGSAPVPLSPGGAVEHAYDAGGTYTATLTVTDAAGDVVSTSTAVVVDP
jgi:hypothetical protein